MKKFIYLIICIFIFNTKILSSELNLAPNAQSAILIENSTGKIIYNHRTNLKRIFAGEENKLNFSKKEKSEDKKEEKGE